MICIANAASIDSMLRRAGARKIGAIAANAERDEDAIETDMKKCPKSALSRIIWFATVPSDAYSTGYCQSSAEYMPQIQMHTRKKITQE